MSIHDQETWLASIIKGLLVALLLLGVVLAMEFLQVLWHE